MSGEATQTAPAIPTAPAINPPVAAEPQIHITSNDFTTLLNNGKNFVVKHKIAFVLLLVLFLQFFPNQGFLPWGGLWVRMQTKGMAHAYTLAAKDVTEDTLAYLEQKIGEKLPDKTVQERKKLAVQEFFRKRNYYWELMQSKIDKRAKEYRAAFAYEQGNKMYSYIYNIDSFYFLRFARNIIEKGEYGDSLKDGKQFDRLVTAPLGTTFDRAPVHAYTLAWLYKLFRFFDSSVPLMEAAAFFPVILAFLTIVLAFFMGYFLNSLTAGFFSAILVGLLGNGVGLTLWGNIDTDAYNLFFPLLITSVFLYGLSARGWKQPLGLSVCGFLFAVYALLWQGWWFLFDAMLGVLGINSCYNAYLQYKTGKSQLKKSITTLLIITITTGLFVTFILNFDEFALSFGNAFQYKKSITSGFRFGIWPNVYTTVSELGKVPLHKVIGSIGGLAIFGISALSLLLAAFRQRNTPAGIVCLLVFAWLAGMTYSSTNAVRFMLLLVVPVSIGFGLFFGKSMEYAGKISFAKMSRSLVIFAGFGMILFSQQIQGGYSAVVSEEPFIDDAWQSVLETIKASSLPDAIITSWWDFGHVFKYVADRPVTIDGGSQTRTATYWVGRMFTTPDENEAVGILRMLDCGSTNAFEHLENMTDTLTALGIINELIMVNKEQAENILKQKGIASEKIIPYIKCQPPQAFVIASADMVRKTGAWGHFGLWNFTKAMAVNIANGKQKSPAVKELQKHIGWDENTAKKEYDTMNAMLDVKDYIAPTPVYNPEGAKCINDSTGLVCVNGLRVNLSTMESTGINTNKKYGVVYPVKDGTFAVKTPANTTVNAYQLLIPFNNSIETVLASSELATSMFTRLFFYQGHGLKHFKLLTWKPSMTKGPIFAYRIDWDGNEQFLLENAFNQTKII
ncbi:MAG: hypothetical protein HY363_04640 [Candidatus Aenigmarchaeota archaeon]|nr:hypothetical protein [Candidatus Aenigmarchaeota archaeon]